MEVSGQLHTSVATFLPQLGIKQWFFDHPACFLLTIHTELSQLHMNTALNFYSDKCFMGKCTLSLPTMLSYLKFCCKLCGNHSIWQSTNNELVRSELHKILLTVFESTQSLWVYMATASIKQFLQWCTTQKLKHSILLHHHSCQTVPSAEW